MPCIPCKRKKLNMEDKIKQLAAAGRNANTIAAMLMIHKHIVDDVLSGKSTAPTQEIVEEPIVEEPIIEKPKRKKRKSIEDETL